MQTVTVQCFTVVLAEGVPRLTTAVKGPAKLLNSLLVGLKREAEPRLPTIHYSIIVGEFTCFCHAQEDQLRTTDIYMPNLGS